MLYFKQELDSHTRLREDKISSKEIVSIWCRKRMLLVVCGTDKLAAGNEFGILHIAAQDVGS